MIQAEIIADSLSPQRNRLTTFVVTFPRIILAEFNTHRMFSRNSASSRAIPFKKMVQMVEENPFTPLAWQKDHKGMQGDEYFNEGQSFLLEKKWLLSRDNAVKEAKILTELGVTKQLCNRLLEPFMWHKVIITSSEEGLENFFKLRCPQYSWQNKGKFRSWKDLVHNHFENGASRDWVDGVEEADKLTRLQNNNSQAEIHIQALAECMWDAYNESTPKQLKAGEWHIPFGDNLHWNPDKSDFQKFYYNQELEKDEELLKVKIAIARCARISYQTLGDNTVIDYEKDLQLFERLKESEHFSPFEHVARAMSNDEHWDNFIGDSKSDGEGWCRNFRGFIQYRTLID